MRELRVMHRVPLPMAVVPIPRDGPPIPNVPENRGEINGMCPDCGSVVIPGISALGITVLEAIRCRGCRTWCTFTAPLTPALT